MNPGFGIVVVLVDLLIEFPSNSTDDSLVAAVRKSEPAGSQPSNMPTRFNQYDGVSHASDLNGRRNSGGCTTINDDVSRSFIGESIRLGRQILCAIKDRD